MATTEDLHFLLEIVNFSGAIDGRKRFQKTVCVLKHRDNIPLGFKFIPYFYGPYSEGLADTIQSLVGAGYVDEEANEINVGVFQYKYSLTEQGIREIQQLAEQPILNVNPDQLQDLVRRINDMDLNELVRISKTLDLNQEPIPA